METTGYPVGSYRPDTRFVLVIISVGRPLPAHGKLECRVQVL
jgi:hypothetical protein